MGSGRFAIPSLEAVLAQGHSLLAVVTQPDKPQGRGRGTKPPPLKEVALARGLEIFQPQRIREAEAVETLRRWAPELQVVVAYGQILPRAVLEIPARGSVNVHASLLPKYRGAAPIQWAIVNGETETGVTTMLLDEGMDTGPMLLSRAIPIGSDENAGALGERLARLGGELLAATLDGLLNRELPPRPQDHGLATRARIIRKEDGRVDWREPAERIERKIRGFSPWPGMTASFRGNPVKLLRAEVDAGTNPNTASGAIVSDGRRALAVVCGGGTSLRLLEVQPASRGPMSATAFVAGARLLPNDRFD